MIYFSCLLFQEFRLDKKTRPSHRRHVSEMIRQRGGVSERKLFPFSVKRRITGGEKLQVGAWMSRQSWRSRAWADTLSTRTALREVDDKKEKNNVLGFHS